MDGGLVVGFREMLPTVEVWRASLEPSSATVTVGDAAKALLLDVMIAVSPGPCDDVAASSVARLVASGVAISSNRAELLV